MREERMHPSAASAVNALSNIQAAFAVAAAVTPLRSSLDSAPSEFHDGWLAAARSVYCCDSTVAARTSSNEPLASSETPLERRRFHNAEAIVLQ